MLFRLKHRTTGLHTRVQVYAGKGTLSLGRCGELVMSTEEFEFLRAGIERTIGTRHGIGHDIEFQEDLKEIERLQQQIETLKGYIARTAVTGDRASPEPPASKDQLQRALTWLRLQSTSLSGVDRENAWILLQNFVAAPEPCTLQAAINLIADDSYAITFQSMAQYRKTVLGILRDRVKQQPAPPPAEQPSVTEIIRQMKGRAADSEGGTTIEVLLSDLRSVVTGMQLAGASQPSSAALKVGDTVQIDDVQHPCHGDVATITSFVPQRIELEQATQFGRAHFGARVDQVRPVPTKESAP